MPWGLGVCLVERRAWEPAASGGGVWGPEREGDKGKVYSGLEAQRTSVELSKEWLAKQVWSAVRSF